MNEPARVPSGVEGLDTILHGGFLKGSIYLVAGQPGTGKTILGNQIAFSHVASGGRVVYVSLLSESHGHLFSNLSSLSFFKEGPIASTLYYVSAYSTLQKEGLKGLVALLQALTRDHAASLMVIDGALNAESSAATQMEFKEFIRQLQVFAEVAGLTVLMLMSLGSGGLNSEQVAGRTTVDGLVELSQKRVGMRSVRELEVCKFRGSVHMDGGHTFYIGPDGIEVYPRTEALLAGSAPGAYDASVVGGERVSLGLKRLDEMMQGGLPRGSSTVVIGPSGSGKTMLGLQFLAEGARQGEPGLYFGLGEPASLAIDAGDRIGLHFSDIVKRGKVEVLWQPPVESALDKIAAQLLGNVRGRKVQRLFIDGLEGLSRLSVYPERNGSFFTALSNELRRLRVTTVSSLELTDQFSPAVVLPIDGISGVAENIILLRSVELRSHLHRLISILKMRRTGYDAAIRELEISDKGIKVAGTFESAEAILTGVARTLPSKE
jgi:circadian clock protein KaiC